MGGIVGAGGGKSRNGPRGYEGPGRHDRAKETGGVLRGSGEVMVSWEGGPVAVWAVGTVP